MQPEQIENLIRLGIDGCEVMVETDGLGHYQAKVISDQFIGKSMIQRHRIIYQYLGSLVGNEIHALALKAFTVEES